MQRARHAPEHSRTLHGNAGDCTNDPASRPTSRQECAVSCPAPGMGGVVEIVSRGRPRGTVRAGAAIIELLSPIQRVRLAGIMPAAALAWLAYQRGLEPLQHLPEEKQSERGAAPDRASAVREDQ